MISAHGFVQLARDMGHGPDVVGDDELRRGGGQLGGREAESLGARGLEAEQQHVRAVDEAKRLLAPFGGREVGHPCWRRSGCQRR